jgi:hypothetical protein
MPNDFVNVNPTGPKPQPQLLLNFRNAVAQVLMQGPVLLGEMNHMFDGARDPIDWGTLENNFGLPAGTGQTVFNLVNGTMGAVQGTMQNAQAVALVNQVG